MNGRLLMWGLIVLGSVLALTVLARPGKPRPQETARVDLFPARAETHRASSADPAPAVAQPTRRPRAARAVVPMEPAKDGPQVDARDATVAVAKDAPAKNAPIPTDPAKPKKPKEKPIEREALAFVGADPVAEAIWLGAINSPDVSAHDRSDLIEDLNEDGFADPKNLTPDDLTLIVNRLELIEREAPYAMDDVNAAAFAEAYKDLVNMYAKVTGNR
jgi:hypothetical protein